MLVREVSSTSTNQFKNYKGCPQSNNLLGSVKVAKLQLLQSLHNFWVFVGFSKLTFIILLLEQTNSGTKDCKHRLVVKEPSVTC